ncbi:NAD(P)H-dependent oxidoreductase [Phyllobacterium sp. UNC302MFCol5.2]|uniref:NAD(P)H-dependent oxidoreductase n=1 Tax=Phyllobacterium sp. UNC302MFCol5.2 TaxID=1449065 RepID=UPI000483981A|nr:NAD(P)H-dependent oxidoreductase [Phyllobacterium sp. UNC302MFCol5.2]
MGKSVVVVFAHPLKDSLCAHLASLITARLDEAGHSITFADLYERGFDPRLTANERKAYYADAYDRSAVALHAEDLVRADILILVFPTWWFGLPAILKGWIDRLFVPGVAYDHAPDFGRMIPRLTRLKSCLAVTTLGSPWWIDWFVMFRPVRRILSRAIIGTCAPQARFSMLSLYNTEQLSAERLAAFERRLGRKLERLI